MPVFFVRDGMKFPDMVHALKPNPVNHIQEGWRIADFFSHVPEGKKRGERWGRGGRGAFFLSERK
jgi:catalase